MRPNRGRLAFTPTVAVHIYLSELLASGLWGNTKPEVVNNLLREGILALAARGVTFRHELKKKAG